MKECGEFSQLMPMQDGTLPPAEQRQTGCNNLLYGVDHLREELIWNDLIWLSCQSTLESVAPGKPHFGVDVDNRRTCRNRLS
jgi:hypothetical protein